MVREYSSKRGGDYFLSSSVHAQGRPHGANENRRLQASAVLPRVLGPRRGAGFIQSSPQVRCLRGVAMAPSSTLRLPSNKQLQLGSYASRSTKAAPRERQAGSCFNSPEPLQASWGFLLNFGSSTSSHGAQGDGLRLTKRMFRAFVHSDRQKQLKGAAFSQWYSGTAAGTHGGASLSFSSPFAANGMTEGASLHASASLLCAVAVRGALSSGPPEVQGRTRAGRRMVAAWTSRCHCFVRFQPLRLERM